MDEPGSGRSTAPDEGYSGAPKDPQQPVEEGHPDLGDAQSIISNSEDGFDSDSFDDDAQPIRPASQALYSIPNAPISQQSSVANEEEHDNIESTESWSDQLADISTSGRPRTASLTVLVGTIRKQDGLGDLMDGLHPDNFSDGRLHPDPAAGDLATSGAPSSPKKSRPLALVMRNFKKLKDEVNLRIKPTTPDLRPRSDQDDNMDQPLLSVSHDSEAEDLHDTSDGSLSSLWRVARDEIAPHQQAELEAGHENIASSDAQLPYSNHDEVSTSQETASMYADDNQEEGGDNTPSSDAQSPSIDHDEVSTPQEPALLYADNNDEECHENIASSDGQSPSTDDDDVSTPQETGYIHLYADDNEEYAHCERTYNGRSEPFNIAYASMKGNFSHPDTHGALCENRGPQPKKTAAWCDEAHSADPAVSPPENYYKEFAFNGKVTNDLDPDDKEIPYESWTGPNRKPRTKGSLDGVGGYMTVKGQVVDPDDVDNMDRALQGVPVDPAAGIHGGIHYDPDYPLSAPHDPAFKPDNWTCSCPPSDRICTEEFVKFAENTKKILVRSNTVTVEKTLRNKEKLELAGPKPPSDPTAVWRNKKLPTPSDGGQSNYSVEQYPSPRPSDHGVNPHMQPRGLRRMAPVMDLKAATELISVNYTVPPRPIPEGSDSSSPIPVIREADIIDALGDGDLERGREIYDQRRIEDDEFAADISARRAAEEAAARKLVPGMQVLRDNVDVVENRDYSMQLRQYRQNLLFAAGEWDQQKAIMKASGMRIGPAGYTLQEVEKKIADCLRSHKWSVAHITMQDKEYRQLMADITQGRLRMESPPPSATSSENSSCLNSPHLSQQPQPEPQHHSPSHFMQNANAFDQKSQRPGEFGPQAAPQNQHQTPVKFHQSVNASDDYVMHPASYGPQAMHQRQQQQNQQQASANFMQNVNASGQYGAPPVNMGPPVAYEQQQRAQNNGPVPLGFLQMAYGSSPLRFYSPDGRIPPSQQATPVQGGQPEQFFTPSSHLPPSQQATPMTARPRNLQPLQSPYGMNGLTPGHQRTPHQAFVGAPPQMHMPPPPPPPPAMWQQLARSPGTRRMAGSHMDFLFCRTCGADGLIQEDFDNNRCYGCGAPLRDELVQAIVRNANNTNAYQANVHGQHQAHVGGYDGGYDSDEDDDFDPYGAGSRRDRERLNLQVRWEPLRDPEADRAYMMELQASNANRVDYSDDGMEEREAEQRGRSHVPVRWEPLRDPEEDRRFIREVEADAEAQNRGDVYYNSDEERGRAFFRQSPVRQDSGGRSPARSPARHQSPIRPNQMPVIIEEEVPELEDEDKEWDDPQAGW